MQSAKNIANICDCCRSFLFIFALFFAVFFALCKKYRNFFCSLLRSAKYIANICGIFYDVQIIAPKYTLFSRKYLRNYMSWQTKCKFLRNHLCITENFAKNTAIFLRKCTLCKKYRRFTPQILLLTQNITAQCTLCILLRGGWGWRGTFVIKKLCCRFCWLFWGGKIINFRKRGGGTLIQNI